MSTATLKLNQRMIAVPNPVNSRSNILHIKKAITVLERNAIQALFKAVEDLKMKESKAVIVEKFTAINNVLKDAPTLCVLSSGLGVAFYHCDEDGIIKNTDKVAEIEIVSL